MIIEDRLTFDDGSAPVPTPTPQPIPAPTPQPRTITLPSLSTILPHVVMIAALAFGSWQWWANREKKPTPTPGPTPAPVVDATKDGAAWAKELPITFADSFAQAQSDVRNTEKPLDAIRKEHVERWKTARDAAFNKRFVPILDQAIPPGNDKPTMEDRRRYAEAMGQIIQGVREAVK